MEKIIFFIIAIPILVFVFYLGGSAIMKGFKAKIENKPEVDTEIDKENNNIQDNKNENLSQEILRLNELLKSGVLTQEEFDKAKRKILGD
tara:strand:+ start:177 stop:446 length:270 start_codon:yes stop_codon:yes gene_type:complete